MTNAMSQHHIMMKTVAICAITFCATNIQAQISPHTGLQNIAQLTASGSVEVQQDLLSVSMSTTRDGADAQVVQNQLKQALDSALVQAKQAALVGQLDVRTGNFSLYPRYGKDGKVNGWQGSSELVLEGKDFVRITGTAGKIQTLTLGHISFGLSREQRAQAEGEAQTQAIERFKAKALDVAKGFGFTGYTLRDVSINSNDQGYTARPRMMAIQAKSDMNESTVPVEAGKTNVLVNVTGSIQMR